MLTGMKIYFNLWKKKQNKQISFEFIGKNIHDKVNLWSTDSQKLDLQVNMGPAHLFEVISSAAASVRRKPLPWFFKIP